MRLGLIPDGRDLNCAYSEPRPSVGADADQLNMGQVVLIDSEGVVCNEHGTPLFKLVREPTSRGRSG